MPRPSARTPGPFRSARQLGKINEQRQGLGRPLITPETCPDIADAPPKKTRSDKGRRRPKNSAPGTESPRPRATSPTTIRDTIRDTSLRRGFATAARAAGHDPLEIGRQGGWSDGSRVLTRYMAAVDRVTHSPLIGIGL
jgi:hypothetical protein